MHTVIVCLTILLFTIYAPASADTTIPISGNINFAPAEWAAFNFSGPSLSAYNVTSDWGTVSVSCFYSSCPFSMDAPAPGPNHGGPNGSASFDGITSVILFGDMNITATISGGPISDPDLAPLMASFPATVSGHLIVYQQMSSLIHCCSLLDNAGPELFSIDLTGSGTLQLSGIALGGYALYHNVVTDFTGTAVVSTPVPEPSTLLLLLTGLFVVSWRKLKGSKFTANLQCYSTRFMAVLIGALAMASPAGATQTLIAGGFIYDAVVNNYGQVAYVNGSIPGPGPSVWYADGIHSAPFDSTNQSTGEGNKYSGTIHVDSIDDTGLITYRKSLDAWYPCTFDSFGTAGVQHIH